MVWLRLLLVLIFGLMFTQVLCPSESYADSIPLVTNNIDDSGTGTDGHDEPPVCLDRDDIIRACKNILKLLDHSCHLIFPVLGCILDEESFCDQACSGETRPLRKAACIVACQDFVRQSPGPYTPIAERFITEACKETTRDAKKALIQACNAAIAAASE